MTFKKLGPKLEEPKYPNIRVQLTGEDGNAFSIMGRVLEALKKGRVPKEERDKFCEEVTSSEDYTALLGVVMKWVDAN